MPDLLLTPETPNEAPPNGSNLLAPAADSLVTGLLLLEAARELSPQGEKVLDPKASSNKAELFLRFVSLLPNCDEVEEIALENWPELES